MRDTGIQGNRTQRILNPPWGFAFSQDQLADLEDIYTTAATGESFSIFIELGLKLLRANGTLAYVLPQSILNVKLHEPIRHLLLSCTQIEKIDLIGDSFCGVYAPALTLTAKKATPSPSHNLEVLDEDTSYEIPQDRFIHNDSAIFNVTSTGREQEILEKMKSIEGVMYLEGNAKFALGIVTGNNKKFVHKAKPEGGELILRGSDIFKYNFYPSENYIIYDPDRFQQVAPTELYRAEEKLIYRFINEQLICAYDDKQTLTLNSANIVIPHIAGYSIKYILAILNSRCAQFFFKQSFSSVKVLRRHLESIPIPPCSPELQRQIIGYVDKMLNTQEPGMREELYDSIEGLVSKVYTVDTRESRLISRSIPENVFLYR
ncbi:MAG TPA: hypothetical protein GXX58_11625 [Gelria sp.]|nr:hypothetical protein [Gelria sp.]